MTQYKFLFDLDGTITLEETLPRIATQFNLAEQIADLTSATIRGDVPFIESFIRRVGILGKLPVEQVDAIVGETPLNPEILAFIHAHLDQCAVVTGNFRGWVTSIMKNIGCQLHCSEGEVDDTGNVKLTKILKKEEVVRQYQAQGYTVIYIGDGNNDAEAMREADFSIACGIIHWPAASVLNLCNFAVFDEKPLIRLFQQILDSQDGVSLVISCAGIGSRLGMDQTKALIKIGKKTIIEHHLQSFKDVEDIRIVVGFQAKELIDKVIQTRKDILFVFNHDYFHTKTGTSVYLGSQFSRQYIIAWDGDLIVHPDDVVKCLQHNGEYAGISDVTTDDGVNVRLNENQEVISFTRESGDFEWSGPACIAREQLHYVSGHLYTMLEPFLPMPGLKIRAFDIDTSEDYQQAVILWDEWSTGNHKIHSYYDKMAENIKKQQETRNKGKDFSHLDIAFVRKHACEKHSLLDLGSGTGLLLNHIDDCFERIVAVEKYPQFSKFIKKANNIEIINEDIANFHTTEKFDVVTMFGLMNYFNRSEAEEIYKKAYQFTKDTGMLIVKHQMGVHEDVIVNGYSEELATHYYSEYRYVENELELLKSIGFKNIECFDIYPEIYNRWENTHFYAFICKKQ